jgi:hypothetical protein
MQWLVLKLKEFPFRDFVDNVEKWKFVPMSLHLVMTVNDMLAVLCKFV